MFRFRCAILLFGARQPLTIRRVRVVRKDFVVDMSSQQQGKTAGHGRAAVSPKTTKILMNLT